jgi:hypothetical protein
MELSIIRDGQRFPYSIAQLRKDNPSVSFPRDLTGVDLTPFGVIVEATKYAKPEHVDPEHDMVPMHCWLYGLREFGLRVQFEDYVLLQQGHARDYWMSAPYVAKSSTYVQHVREYFQLGDADFNRIWRTAESIEE